MRMDFRRTERKLMYENSYHLTAFRQLKRCVIDHACGRTGKCALVNKTHFSVFYQQDIAGIAMWHKSQYVIVGYPVILQHKPLNTHLLNLKFLEDAQ